MVKETMSRKSEQFLAIGLLVFCVLTYFVLIPTIPLGIDTGAEMGFFSPRVFPKFIIIIIAVLSIILGIGTFKDRTEDRSGSRDNIFAFGNAGVVLSVGFVYIFLLEWIGYTISTPLVLALLIWFFGGKNWIKIILVTISTTIILSVFFGKILKVMVPTGRFF